MTTRDKPTTSSADCSSAKTKEHIGIRYDGTELGDPSIHWFEEVDAHGNGTERYYPTIADTWNTDELVAFYAQFIPCFTFKGRRYDFRRGA